jgi:NAD(P)-dependent dehydrogenase (short-subunit alcohol dehydrogenase family)
MCLGAVHGSQRVLPGMLRSGHGVLLFVGATASVKAGAGFSAFGAAKFALRGLAQSLARELGPRGIHVAHLVIDGVIWGERAAGAFGMTRAQCLEPDALAHTCLHLIEQDRCAWTHELDIRPDREPF